MLPRVRAARRCSNRPASILAAALISTAVAAGGPSTHAQPATPQASSSSPLVTFIGAIAKYPAFFHGRQVIVYGTLRHEENDSWLESDAGERLRLAGPRPGASGARVELRGEVLDVGRATQTDPRVTDTAVQGLLLRRGLGQWPRPGQLVLLRTRAAIPHRAVTSPSLRAVVLESDRFADQPVTVVGEFRGPDVDRSLPDRPGRQANAFVLTADGASVWVVGLRPRVNNVDLDLKGTTDLGGWLAVAGTVRRRDGLVVIDGERLGFAPIPQAQPEAAVAGSTKPADVIFSVPTADDIDVPLSTTVRIQFSKAIDPATLAGRITAAYVGPPPDGAPGGPPPAADADYSALDHVLTLRFRAPLQPRRAVRITIASGVMARDGAPVNGWRLTFTTGEQEPHAGSPAAGAEPRAAAGGVCPLPPASTNASAG